MSHEYINIDSTQEKPTNDSFSKRVRIIVAKVQPFKTLPMDSSVCHPLPQISRVGKQMKKEFFDLLGMA